QEALGVGLSCLASAEGRLLARTGKVADAGLRHGDTLTATVRSPRLFSRRHAYGFVLIRGDGSVVSWTKEKGLDTRQSDEADLEAMEVQTTAGAVAVLCADGRVVSWGETYSGGDSSAVRKQLHDVRSIQASAGAFAALRSDGRVVTWGIREAGGDSEDVQEQLQHVAQLQASARAFAAVTEGGSVVTWGHPTAGGDSSDVQSQLHDVEGIFASGYSFLALRRDGSAITWGSSEHGAPADR
ncbi:Herc2, partial [Symbiodinium natans]